MSLDKYKLDFEEISADDQEADLDPLFNEQLALYSKYTPMCEAVLDEVGECPNKATVEWFRSDHEGDYFYTMRCDEHPPAHQELYDFKDL